MPPAYSESEIPSSLTNDEFVVEPALKKGKANPKNAEQNDLVRSSSNRKTILTIEAKPAPKRLPEEAKPEPNPVSNKRKVGRSGGNSSTDEEPEALEGAPIKRTRGSKAKLVETRTQAKGKGN